MRFRVCYRSAATNTSLARARPDMDDSFNLARHVARFALLLMRQPESIDQQKLELRAIALMTKEGTVRLTTREGQLVANGISVPAVLAGVRELADQIIGHQVESFEIHQGMSPGELLNTARLIAEPLTVDPVDFRKRVAALAVTTVTVQFHAEAVAEAGAEAQPAVPEPATGSPERIPFLLERANRSAEGVPNAADFDEVAFAVEQATREGRTATVMDVFLQLITYETAASDPEVQRQFVLTVRRLMKPRILQPIARAFLDNLPRVADAATILGRCGTDGAEAVVDQYARAATRVERDAFLAAFDRLPATDESLVAMLADARPHIMRVAAELLGLRRPRDGDKVLADHLAEGEVHSRRAAIRALAGFDTDFSLDAIARGLGDAAVEVRLEAVGALARRDGPRTAEIIANGIEAEEEEEVQVAMLAALGRIGTADAVARIAKVVEAGAGFFSSRKGSAVRVAAVHALADARTAGARTALLTLTHDKEREVRDAAARAIGR